MNKDWHRVELLRSLGTLVAEGVLDLGGAKACLAAYDERKEAQMTLDLVMHHEANENPVSLDEAYSSVMTGIPLPDKPGVSE